MRRLVEQLYGAAPREFASPQRRMAESTDRLLEMVDEHNGLTDCFVSVYGFADADEPSYGNVVVNKAVFDFDGEWDELVRAHHWLDERGVAHFVVFSGSDESGHLYVLTKPTRHQQSLEYFQRNIVIDRAGLRRCSRCGNGVSMVDSSAVASWECDTCEARLSKNETRLVVDSNLVGDAATMIRIPNTWHPRAERFCIPLKPNEINHDPERIYELAQSQRDLTLGDIVCGHKTPDITQHKAKAEELYYSHDEKRRLAGFESDAAVLDEFEAEVTPAEMMKDIECECVRSMITDGQDRRTMPALGHSKRRVLVSYLVERGYNPEEIARFLRFVLDDDKARHSIVEEEQPVRIWRDGVKAPNAVGLKRVGLFRQDCPEHAKVATEVEA